MKEKGRRGEGKKNDGKNDVGHLARSCCIVLADRCLSRACVPCFLSIAALRCRWWWWWTSVSTFRQTPTILPRTTFVRAPLRLFPPLSNHPYSDTRSVWLSSITFPPHRPFFHLVSELELLWLARFHRGISSLFISMLRESIEGLVSIYGLIDRLALMLFILAREIFDEIGKRKIIIYREVIYKRECLEKD